MKLFLCWSGRRSQVFAEILSEWLPKVVGDKLKPKVSREIEKGVVWFDALRRDLEGSGAGLLCLTPESLTSPWMHYEAGALSGTLGKTPPLEGPLSSQLQPIFPFLPGVEAGALTGPFAAYQSTSAASCEDSFRLIKSIESAMPAPERPTWDLRAKFDQHWPDLQTKLKAILPASIDEVFEELESLFHRKTFDEPIHDCLDQTWLARYDGARETHSKLSARRVTVRGGCRPYVADVFDALIAEVKAYAMNTSVLVGLQKFPIDKEGHVEIEPVGIAEACERRRKKIRSLVARLVDASQAPVLDEAFRFEVAETFEERKKLVHRKTAELRQAKDGKEVWDPADKARWADSDWDFDRITYYLLRESEQGLPLDEELGRARIELEKVRSKKEGASLMALHYSLGPLEKALSVNVPPSTEASSRVQSLMSDILNYLEKHPAARSSQLQRTISRIKKMLPQSSVNEIADTPSSVAVSMH